MALRAVRRAAARIRSTISTAQYTDSYSVSPVSCLSSSILCTKTHPLSLFDPIVRVPKRLMSDQMTDPTPANSSCSYPQFVSSLGPFPLDHEFNANHVRTALLIKKWDNRTAARYARQMGEWLESHGVQVFVEPTTVRDYHKPYPSIFDLMNHTDPGFAQSFERSFPHAAYAFPKDESPAVKYFRKSENKAEDPIPGHSTCLRAPAPNPSFWKGFERTPESRDALSSLDKRESIAFCRKRHTWQCNIDLVVCVGGDGTLLHVSALFPHKVPPTLAFGCGSFGFLMPFSPAKAPQTLERLFNNNLRVFNRSRIAFKIGGIIGTDHRGAAKVPPFSIDDPEVYHLLNEVALKHTYGLNINAGLSEIECRIDGEFLARFQGDGLMIASPTGSTAYSMAAGGSIVHPALRCLLLSPIAPMTLSSRPMILPGQSTVTLKPLHDSVLLEGKYGRVIQPEEVVTIRRSEFSIPVFTRSGVTEDWVNDMGTRMNYARQVRVRQVDDPVEMDDNTENVAQGLWVHKNRKQDKNP